jgi:hypothetical protein
MIVIVARLNVCNLFLYDEMSIQSFLNCVLPFVFVFYLYSLNVYTVVFLTCLLFVQTLGHFELIFVFYL